MRPIDRIVSRRGHADLRERESTIPSDELDPIRQAMYGFFGTDVPSLDVLDQPMHITAPSPFDQLFEQCLACDSAEAVRAVVMGHARGDGPLATPAQQALASHRWLGILIAPPTERLRVTPLSSARATWPCGVASAAG